MRNLETSLRRALAAGKLDLPCPGRGKTASRFAALYEFGASDLSFARLAEAHTDATAILAEAGRGATAGNLYGVWASDGPGSELRLTRQSSGAYSLDGCKKYCSGAPLLDSALVTARTDEGIRLVAVDLTGDGLSIESTWAAPAFAATGTSTVTFRDARVTEEQLIGGAAWYLDRPGFWHGAVGPAACWAGGARGLLNSALAPGRRDAHAKAHLGAIEADDWGACALLNEAGRQIDADPGDARRTARTRALKVRHLIERLCADVLDRFGRATGPGMLAFDAGVARRYSEVSLYIRQCHAERDLEALFDLQALPG